VDRLRRLRRLPRAERAVLVEAWLTFLLVDVALRTLPFARLLAHCSRPARRPRPSPAAARLAHLVEAAARHVPVRAGCLERALVLGALLRRRGIAATITIGVTRHHAGVAAHAWVEHDGAIVLGAAGGEFTPLLSAVVGAAP